MARKKALPGDEARESAGQQRTAATRKRRREATASSHSDDYKLLNSSWLDIASHKQTWKDLCRTTFNAMMICCLCGVVHLGYDETWVSSMAALPDLASPAAAANVAFR